MTQSCSLKTDAPRRLAWIPGVLLAALLCVFADPAVQAQTLPAGSIVFGDISGVYTSSGIECNGSASFQDGICEGWWGPAAAWSGCPGSVSSTATVDISLKSSNQADLDENSTAPLVQTYTVKVDISGAQLFGCLQFGSYDRTKYLVNNFTISYMGDFNIEFQRINVGIQSSSVGANSTIPFVSALPAGNDSQTYINVSAYGSCSQTTGTCDIGLRYGWPYNLEEPGHTIGMNKGNVCNGTSEGSVGDSPLMCLDVKRPDLGWTGGRSLHTGGGAPFDVSGASQALDFTPAPEPTADSSANCTLCSSAAEPVNTFSGELYEPLPPDINLGGPMPLTFGRHYAAFLRRSFIVGDLGSNWRHNFDARLFISGNAAKYISYKGRVTDFVKDLATGTWEQQTNLDTTYKLNKPASQNAALFDPQDNLIYTFDFTTSNVIIGKLASVADGKGNVHTITYDLLSGQIQTVSDGLGRTLTFNYNTGAIPKISVVSDGTRSVEFQYTDPVDTEYLTLVTDVRGGVTTYAYKDTSANADHALMLNWTLPRGNMPYSQTFDAQGRVLVQTDASSNTTSFAYGTPTTIQTTLTDPVGNTRVHSAEATGAFNGMQDQAGQNFTLTTDASGRRNSVTDRLGDTTSINYHAASGKLSGVTNADGTTESFAYTPRTTSGLTLHDMNSVTNPDGTKETQVHDAFGNLTSRTDQRGSTQTFTYNSFGQVLSATNEVLGVTTNTYNADATLASSMDPASNTTTFGYDLLKRPNLTTNADNSTSSMTFDLANHPLTITDENGNTTTMTYDANGNLATVRDPLLKTTTFTYDGNDRLIKTTDAIGGVSSVTYHPLGGMATTTDANGNLVTFGYNTMGRLTSLTDALGNIWSRTYDAEKILASTADPLGNTTSFVSDKMGRITQTTSPLGNINKVSYDPMGRIATTTDALNQVTTFSRDLRGQVTGITLPGGTISSTITRNAVGQPLSVTDPNGNAWARAYDSSGRLTSSTDPLGQAKNTTYDNRNRPSVITLPGALGTKTLSYDVVGNLTGVTYSGGTTFGFTYDANNRMTAANNGGVTPNNITRAYDANGRISNSNGIAISRDAGGRILTMSFAAGTVTYAYDVNDHVTSVTDWLGGVTTFTYDNVGRLTGIIRPNGVITTNTWDADSRLIGISEGAISSINLTRDAKGQITTATRTVPQPASAATLTSSAHTLDAASQVIGNTYDALGRRTAGGADTFSWDSASRLTNYTVGGGTASNVYDALGRRTGRTEGGTSSNYVWNDTLGLPSISIERRAGSDFRYFIHTPGGALLYSINAATNARSFYHYDEMGNTIFITNGAGTVIGSYAYTPFGQLIASTGALDNPFTWQGKNGLMDESNGLYYVRARYYDSETGRFISKDPKESINPRRINPYQYAQGNPLFFVDPTGEDELEADDPLGETLGDIIGALARVSKGAGKAGGAVASVVGQLIQMKETVDIVAEQSKAFKWQVDMGVLNLMLRVFNDKDPVFEKENSWWQGSTACYSDENKAIRNMVRNLKRMQLYYKNNRKDFYGTNYEPIDASPWNEASMEEITDVLSAASKKEKTWLTRREAIKLHIPLLKDFKKSEGGQCD